MNKIIPSVPINDKTLRDIINQEHLNQIHENIKLNNTYQTIYLLFEHMIIRFIKFEKKNLFNKHLTTEK